MNSEARTKRLVLFGSIAALLFCSILLIPANRKISRVPKWSSSTAGERIISRCSQDPLKASR